MYLKSVRCSSLSKKQKTTWFMQTTDQTYSGLTSINYEMAPAVSPKLLPIFICFLLMKLFCLSVFTRQQKKAEPFQTMSRNNKARSVDTPKYNSKAYNVRGPLSMSDTL